MTDLTTVTATELSSLYQSGAVSPVTVAHQLLAKIKRVNPVVNAFCFTDPETTIKQAQASEQRWYQSQPLSAMDGVPVAVKDVILTRGWPTLRGSCAVDPNQPWTEDAPIISQLRDAGAVLIGKTTTSEFGSKITTDSALNGITRNPWNINYSSGGSSGGSAVAVAVNMVPLSLGTDYIGSVRTPAAFCGTVGFKPTHGLIPHSSNSLFDCSCVGPIARSVDDISLLLNITAELPNISKLKIAYCPDLGFAKNINNEIVYGTAQAAAALAQAGAQVDQIDKLTNDPLNVIGTMYLIDAYHHWNQLTESQKQSTGPAYQHWATQGSKLLHLVDQLKSQQAQLKQTLQEFMMSYDIILSPSTAVTADTFLAEDIEFDPAKLTTDHVPFGYLFNLTHQPAVTVPVGLNHVGMPMGVQLAGAVGKDALLLAVARIVQCMFPMPKCNT